MFVTIPNELIAQIETNESIKRALFTLFSLFYNEEHRWFIQLDDEESLYEAPALESFRSFIEDQVVNSIYASTPEFLVHVCLDDTMIQQVSKELPFASSSERNSYDVLNNHRLTISNPDRTDEFITISLINSFLKQPLKIIVENVASDSLFIKKCLHLFSGIAPDHPNIKFENGGGSSVVHVLDDLGGKHRAICIVDSDRISPDETPPDKIKLHENIRAKCSKYGIALHFLSKKEMENYLSDEALGKYLLEVKHFRTYAEHPYFSDFSAEHKDFFDLKKGLPSKKMSHSIWAEIRSAMDEAAATNIQGFSDEVWHAFHFIETREELEARDGQGELEHLVKKITVLM